MISRVDKENRVSGLSEQMRRAQAGFLVDFQGLSAQQITDLRKSLRSKGFADMKVCRNTLIRRALSAGTQSGDIGEHFDSHLKGSNAFVFAFENPSQVANLLSEYVKKTEVLRIKVGMMEGEVLHLKDIKVLADLPSMEVLRAQFLSVLSAGMSKCLSLFSAVPEGFLRVLLAHKGSKK